MTSSGSLGMLMESIGRGALDAARVLAGSSTATRNAALAAAAGAVRRFGAHRVFWAAAGVALLGLALTLTPALWLVLLGLAAIGAGPVFAQAAATGVVSATARGTRAAAAGLSLTSY